MYKTDFDSFRVLLDQCAEVFGKPKPPDALVQQYWSALKDQPIGQIVACANVHMKFGKHFPRPFELRPKDDKPKHNGRNEAAFIEAEKLADARLEHLRKSDPAEWLLQVSPKVYEMGRARGMPDGLIAQKLQDALAR